MTLSNSKNFELNVTDYIEEAYERCGLELRTGYDLETAKRSMNLLLADWANSCLLYTSPSPRDRQKSRMPSSA